jgi:hypothetical protein
MKLPRAGVSFVGSLLVALFCVACNFQEGMVSVSDDSVGVGGTRSGVTLCNNGLEYRNSHGFGKGVSDVVVSLSGLRIRVCYRLHTFEGFTTKIRELKEFTIP